MNVGEHRNEGVGEYTYREHFAPPRTDALIYQVEGPRGERFNADADDIAAGRALGEVIDQQLVDLLSRPEGVDANSDFWKAEAAAVRWTVGNVFQSSLADLVAIMGLDPALTLTMRRLDHWQFEHDPWWLTHYVTWHGPRYEPKHRRRGPSHHRTENTPGRHRLRKPAAQPAQP